MKTDIYKSKYVVCLNNESYEVSLEFGKIYKTMTDSEANKDNLIRVIDESMEDYLYSAERFAAIDPPLKFKRYVSQRMNV